MNERESFDEMVKFTVSTFKEDAESGLVHMKILLQLVEPTFQRSQRKANDEGAINANGDEAKSARKP